MRNFMSGGFGRRSRVQSADEVEASALARFHTSIIETLADQGVFAQRGDIQLIANKVGFSPMNGVHYTIGRINQLVHAGYLAYGDPPHWSIRQKRTRIRGVPVRYNVSLTGPLGLTIAEGIDAYIARFKLEKLIEVGKL